MKNRPQTNVKFIHCRNINPDGTINPHGGLTIAYNINKDFKVVGWAAAKCNFKDTYNKQIGRMKAAGRLLSNKYYLTVAETDEKTFIEKSHNGFKQHFSPK